jgi:hypothetical protein
MYGGFSERTYDTLIDIATIVGVGLAGWGKTLHLIIACIIGFTIIVKNIYDIRIKMEEKKKLERENNEKDPQISTTK